MPVGSRIGMSFIGLFLFYTFGKSQASFERSRAVTRKINGFLGRPLQTRYEWVEEVGWWFFSPLCLVGWLVGACAPGTGFAGS